MAGKLVVDLGRLGELASDLDDVHSTLARAHKQVDASDAEIGSGRVHGALSDFDSRWDDKRQKIEKSTESLKSMLTDSVDAYEQTDGDLARAVQVQHGGGSPAGGSAAGGSGAGGSRAGQAE